MSCGSLCANMLCACSVADAAPNSAGSVWWITKILGRRGIWRIVWVVSIVCDMRRRRDTDKTQTRRRQDADETARGRGRNTRRNGVEEIQDLRCTSWKRGWLVSSLSVVGEWVAGFCLSPAASFLLSGGLR